MSGSSAFCHLDRANRSVPIYVLDMKRSDAVENRAKIMEVLSNYLQDGSKTLPTMSDIVKSTQLGRGTVYRNFPDIGELFYAYLQDGYEELYSSYEPEWIDDDIILDRFRQFLLDCFEFSRKNHALLVTPACLTSEGRALAKTELRRKIFVTATKLSNVPLKPVELTKWADVIAYCVETEHLDSGSLLEIKPGLSVSIAMNLLMDILQVQSS